MSPPSPPYPPRPFISIILLAGLLLFFMPYRCFTAEDNENATQQLAADGDGGEKAKFILHPQKLDALFHRAATMALLKAKARETLHSLGGMGRQMVAVEQIVFAECVREGGKESPAKYAKCLVKLFRAKDSLMKTERGKNEEEGKKEEEGGIEKEQGGIFGGAMSWLTNLAKGLGMAKKTLLPTLMLRKEGPKQILKKPKAKGEQERKRKKWARKWRGGKKREWRRKWRRSKRAMEKAGGGGANVMVDEGGKMPKNMRALRQLQTYLGRLEWAQNYVRGMSEQSARSLKPFLGQQSIRFVQSSSALLPLLSQIQSILNGTNSANGAGHGPDLSSFSLLSPRLLSLFPAVKAKPKLLSPDLLSFNRDDGFLSLPQLFGMISPNERESLEWLDFMVDLTGAGKQLATLLEKMRPEMDEFERKMWPALERIRRDEERWAMVKASLDGRQKRELDSRGFVHLDGWQQEILFGKKKAKERAAGTLGLEAKIEELAKLADWEANEEEARKNEKKRMRRSEMDGEGEEEKKEEGKENEEEDEKAEVKKREKQEKKEEEGNEVKTEENEKTKEKRQGFDYDGDGDGDDFEETEEAGPPPLGPFPPPPIGPGGLFPPPNFGGGPFPPGGGLFPAFWPRGVPWPACPTGSCVIMGRESNGLPRFHHFGGRSPDSVDSIRQVPRTVLLTPWAFEQRLGGVILEGVYLSPHAFASELVSPEVLTAKVASPSAFMAAILSPMALTARIVSPSAFRSQILSPEALSAYVLSPDVFLAEILSPNVMQARVLSPRALFVQILNPMIASPRLGSPQIGGLVVLSPNFLSPRIYSQESLMVEVLSPHILGGEHELIEGDQWTPDGSTHYVGFPPQG